MDYEEYLKMKKIIRDYESSNDPLVDILAETRERLTMEDTHKRQSYLVRRDLINRLNKLKEERKRGFVTRFINYAIESSLNRIDEYNEKYNDVR